MVNANIFLPITDLVIKHLEGGYYHPDMMKDGRVKYDPRYSTSGETMFGIDRKNGVQLAKYPEWKTFWAVIDKSGARSKWKWNYRGGTLEAELRTLAGKLMYPWFSYLFTKYLSPAAQSLVSSDARLILHFAYAAWNGAGWFERFAKMINSQVAAGQTDVNKLTSLAVKQRTDSSNSLIRQTGSKIASLVTTVSDVVKKKSFNRFSFAFMAGRTGTGSDTIFL